jgi:hypothetical protein
LPLLPVHSATSAAFRPRTTSSLSPPRSNRSLSDRLAFQPLPHTSLLLIPH